MDALGILEICEEYNLHIKVLIGDEPFYTSDGSTHYIMRGCKVLVVINEKNIELWLKNKVKQAEAIKALLDSEFLNYSDCVMCESFLSDTVMPNKNIQIYRELIKCTQKT